MTKLFAAVLKLRDGAIQGASVARMYGQSDAIIKWNAQQEAYSIVLTILGDPGITPSRWKKLICNIFHQKYSLKCPNCGGQI